MSGKNLVLAIAAVAISVCLLGGAQTPKPGPGAVAPVVVNDGFRATTSRIFRPTPRAGKIGHFAYFSPRDKMYGDGDTKPTFFAQGYKRAAASKAIDWVKDYSFPIDLNDELGDCYYAAGCHFDNLVTANAAKESFFNLSAIRTRYFYLSGGDNGLTDHDMQGEMSKRYLADVKEAKVVDFAYINTTDVNSMCAAIERYGAVMFTLAVPITWINNSETGALWDAATYRDNNNGHAVVIGAFNEVGNYKLLTWGTWVYITPAGVNVCSPGGWVPFSTRWFSPAGYAPNGVHIVDLAKQWLADTGKEIPANVISLFPPKGPPPPPGPPPPSPPPPSPPPGGQVNTITWSIDGVSSNWELVPVGTVTRVRELAAELDRVRIK